MKKTFTTVMPLILTSLIWLLIGWTLHSQFGSPFNQAGSIAQHNATALINKAHTLIQNDLFLTAEVTEEQLAYAAIRAMLAQSHDPYAVLFTPPASTAYARDMAGEVEAQIITSYIISSQIGYIQQRFFPFNADKKLQQHLHSLVDQKVQALIWDLRDNTGGAMQATEAILNNFMAQGVFYRAEFKNGQQQTFSADGSAKVVDLPLVVLVNENTYSAGEIAAAALADNQRALLIGTPTEGKGTIQDTITLDEQHLLRITIAKWLPPSGMWTQGKGVTPTLKVKDDPATATDEVLDFAIQYIQQKFLAQR